MAAEDIGTLVPTKIPGYSDAADIQAALRLYHYGSYTFDTEETDPANLINPSIAYKINDLESQIEAIDSLSPALYTSKGSILSASAPSTVSLLSVGSNGTVLTANSGTASGLEWALPAVTLDNSVTLTNKTLTAPVITLSTTSSTSDSRISWDTTNKKLQVGNGTSSLDFASSNLNVSAPSFASNAYTAVLTDKDKFLELSNGTTAGTFYINVDASVNFPIGTQINLIQIATGQITVAATTPGTTTINGTPGLKLRTQWSAATLIKRAANTWVLVGDLIA